MGLTANSTGFGLEKEKKSGSPQAFDLTVSLAGNPNVGKSTLFNRLTGMHQHTGNWAGKTVSGAEGQFAYKGKQIRLVDIPGCYSLAAYSPEEEIARDFICFSGADKTVIVCDATALERNLTLALQTMEITGSCILCINLADEAQKHNIFIDTKKLSALLGIKVISTSARNGKGVKELCDAIVSPNTKSGFTLKYPAFLEDAISRIIPLIAPLCTKNKIMPRWVALRLIENEPRTVEALIRNLGKEIYSDDVKACLAETQRQFEINGISKRETEDTIALCAPKTAKRIAENTVFVQPTASPTLTQRADRLLTGKYTAIPILLLLIAVIFYLTISGANLPSAALSKLLFSLEDFLYNAAISIGITEIISEALFSGVFRTVAWVVSVMLPPMAIFFPLFSLLEDSGILPRIAFNLDRAFQKCHACGKQALTLCMGFGCNAAGVVGCRIINSPRERLIAILTNAFVPCNGKFPGMISIIALFFVLGGGFYSNILSALVLTLFILLGIAMTFLFSRLLSATVLKGMPSFFTLELPPFRRPQFLKTLIRSIFDRTLFVLYRAVIAAAPAGLLIWLAANLNIGNATVLQHITTALDPFGRLLGLDGVILTAFILGIPANEIVIPIMLMAYTANGTLTEITNIALIREILVSNGWTVLTALNFLLFSLLHYPCATTLLTVKSETGSLKWTFAAFLLPTVAGIAMCLLTTLAARIIL